MSQVPVVGLAPNPGLGIESMLKKLNEEKFKHR